MDQSPKQAGSSTDDGWTALSMWALGLVALLLFAPALITGICLYFGLRRWLQRTEWILVGLTGLIGFIVRAQNFTASYILGIKNYVFHHGSLFSISLTGQLLLGAVTAAILGSLRGTAVVGKVPLPKMFGLHKAPDLSKPTLIPDLKQKAKMSVVTPPGGALTVTQDAHSITGMSSPPGARSFPIGMTPGGPAMISEREIGMHGLILGSTGSGKTETIKALAGALLDLGWDGAILDLKEDTKDGGLRWWVNEYAMHHSIPYQEMCLSDPEPAFWFSPLAGCGPDEQRDTVLSLNEFDDAFWQAINKKMLGQAINLMNDAHAVDPMQFPYPTMLELGKLLAQGDKLPATTKKMRGCVLGAVAERSDDDYDSLARPSPDEQKSAVGFGAKLTMIYNTMAGRTVLRAAPGRRLLDVTERGITYIGLDTQGKADLSKVISSAVLQRMSVYAAQRTTGQASGTKPRFLIIDEANWVNREIVMNLLSRARSAGISVWLCTQGPLDWEEDFARLAQNINVSIIMSQGEPESARICADYIGEVDYVEMSRRVVDGQLFDQGTARTETAHRVTPQELRAMTVGEAILRIGKPVEKCTWMHVIQRAPERGPTRAPARTNRPSPLPR